MPDDLLLRFADSLQEAANPKPRQWRSLARPKQLPPDDPHHADPDADGNRCGCEGVDNTFSIYLMLAGRGLGKTWSGANWSIEQALKNPGIVGAVVGPTFRDTRNICFEGPSGIRRQLQKGEEKQWRRNELRLDLVNGSVIYGFSADQPERLRGANLGFAWAEELSSWRYPEAWYEGMVPALRIGEHPRVFVTTTPRPTPLIRDLTRRKDGSVHITRGSTWENAKNLSESALAELKRRYSGTRLGRQELEGELLEDTPGALWRRDDLDAARVGKGDVPDLVRVVVAVDPAMTSGEDADETGIVVAGEDGTGHGYVLADLSMRGSPEQCMRRAVRAYAEFDADCIVAEVNAGGDYLGTVLRHVNAEVPYRQVRASRGKALRAEPVSALSEQHRLHMVGCFPELEDQLCSFVPDIPIDHDDRLDACLVDGTPVITARGEIPIESVVPGDLAWTRQGWKPVLVSALTRRAAQVMVVEISDGSMLTGTPDHRIWVRNKGWIRLDALVCGDRLSGWKNLPSKSGTGASFTSATRTASSERTASTTKPHEAPAAVSCTATSTVTTTVRSPRDTLFTTRITTRSTTIPATCGQSPAPSTHWSTPKWPGSLTSSSPRSAPSRQRGTAVLKASNGTGSTAGVPGTPGSLLTGESARCAAKSSTPGSTGPGTAPGAASTGPAKASTPSLPPAPSAAPPTSVTSTVSDPSPAPVSVVRLCVSSERRDVYDLTVADAHEFTASGIIVHNCVYAVSELRGLSAGNWLNAYGMKRCDDCARTYTDRASRCPHCNPGAENEPRVLTSEPQAIGGWASAYGDFVRCPVCQRPYDKRRGEKCPHCSAGAMDFLKQHGKNAMPAQFTVHGLGR